MKNTHKEVETSSGAQDYSYHLNETGDYRQSWRIFRIMAEFVEGYQFLSSLQREVVVLGSARLSKQNTYTKIARTLGKRLAKEKYTVVTGGGPGIMEAANQGAYEGGGESVGINIQLPFEQRINKYVKKSAAFYYFFTRKVMLTSPANAYVFFPGGFGTFDEFFEVIDHVESGSMCRVPIVLVGREFWAPVIAFLRENCASVNSVSLAEIDRWHITDSVEEAMKYIQTNEIDEIGCELSPMHFYSNTKNVDWRIFRIMAELVEGFEFLTGLVENVTILGTRKIKTTSSYYKDAQALAKILGKNGYTILTGGGDGIAEAANRGASEVGAPSLGVAMEVRGKAMINKYVSRSIIFKFPFTRKLIVTSPSKAFVFFPGGFGTLHQLFEVLTLIQTKKMEPVPIFLYDSKFWGPLHTFIQNELSRHVKTISKEDVLLYEVTDDISMIARKINTFRHRDVPIERSL